MNEVHLLCIGKLKNAQIDKLEKDYRKRLTQIKLTIHELRAHADNLEKEALEIEKKLHELSICSPILLTEKGKSFDSPQFSKWLFEKFQTDSKVALVIGGASGFSEKIQQKAAHKISLGEMTFPHKMARLLLVEQLYRAESIHKNHPYHK